MVSPYDSVVTFFTRVTLRDVRFGVSGGVSEMCHCLAVSINTNINANTNLEITHCHMIPISVKKYTGAESNSLPNSTESLQWNTPKIHATIH